MRATIEGSNADSYVPLSDPPLRPEVPTLGAGPLTTREAVEAELDGILVAVRDLQRGCVCPSTR